jgi:hypothetical protein
VASVLNHARHSTTISADRKNVDLRIPVTLQQKEMVYDALQGAEFASWARDVLLREAGRIDEVRNGEAGTAPPGV